MSPLLQLREDGSWSPAHLLLAAIGELVGPGRARERIGRTVRGTLVAMALGARIRRRRFLELGAAAAALGGCGVDERRVRFPSVSKLGGEIRHFVVLMMENRSYDQMLGALPGHRYAGAPRGT